MPTFWSQRFSSQEYIYGTEPNAFFKQVIDGLKPGKLLVPGAGEGRDAVYAATLGRDRHENDSRFEQGGLMCLLFSLYFYKKNQHGSYYY